MEWFFGIFPMMTIMAGLIGAIMGVRLVHIDKEYKQIINQYEKHIVEIENQLADNTQDNDMGYLIVELKDQHGVVVKTKADREDNRRNGIVIDIISLAGIITLGLVAVFGTFDGILIMMVALSVALFAAPVFYFLHHVMNVTGKSIK